MSESYTIGAVSQQTRDYESNGKAKRVYYVKLDGIAPKDGVQAFELHKLQSSKPPEAGHKLDVKTFQEGEFSGQPFVKIVTDYKAGGSGGFGSASSGGSDDRGESIERQVAAKVAGEMAAATPIGDLGPVAMVSNFEGFFDAVIAKIQDGAQASRNGGGDIPADMSGLPTGPVSDDSQIKF